MRTIRLWLILLSLCVGISLLSAEQSPRENTYYLVITGGELLDGTVTDAHTPFLTKTLYPLGLKCVGVSIVDDLDEDLIAAYRYGTNKSRLVLVTGGLGPTDNDITRQTLSQCTGIPLKEHPDLLRDMTRRFNISENEIRPNLRRQTQVPVQGGYLKNSYGTAAGLVFDIGHGHVIALPGPPRELQSMVRQELIPFLSKHYGIRAQATVLTVRFLGIGQSQIDHVLKQKIQFPPGLIVGSTFEGSRVDFTFSLADDSTAARQTLDKLKAQVLEVLGDNIYATNSDTLEDVVCSRLRERQHKLALVEVGSAGAVMAALSKSAAAQGTIAQSWAAHEEAGLYRSLNIFQEEGQRTSNAADRLKLLANNAARISGADCVLVTGTPQSAGSGSATFSAVLKLPGNQWVEQNFVFRTSAENQPALVTQLLGFLWKKLP